MTPFQKAMHTLGYDLSPDWTDEVEDAARWAARILGKKRVEWIAGADNHFVFGGQSPEHTRRIFDMAWDPVIRAAYGWHRCGPEGYKHVSMYTPKLTHNEMKAAHIWYCLRTTQPTRREEREMERSVWKRIRLNRR